MPKPTPGTEPAADPPAARPRVQQIGVASGHGRVYQAGRDLTVHETVLPATALRPVTEVDAPPATVNVPGHQQVFVGRDDELAALRTALSASRPVVVAAVHGLGGIGKSTLAARYAAAHAGVFNPVWWITADTPTGIRAGLAALAAALQPELAAALPLEALAERATAWLAGHEGWLLVLDDVTRPSDVTPLLARTLTGRVLITSRLGQGWHPLGAQVQRLDVLDEAEALDLLTRIAGPSVPWTPEEGATELVEELGGLPLAIEQAGAYLRQNRLTPRAYLDLLTAYPAEMLDQPAESGDARRTVARVWRLTLDRLADVPPAVDLLRVLAWYAPESVPRDVLDGLAEPPRLQRALGALAAYNMITLDGPGIVVHRLVQAIARTPDPADPHRQAPDIEAARTLAIALLDRAHPAEPDAPESWARWRALLPHIDAAFDRTSPETDTVEAQRLLRATGFFLNGQGAVDRSLTYLKRCLAAALRLHEADHPVVLNARAGLAYAYWTAEDLRQAIPLMEHNLAEEERILGADHPNTLTSRNNLAGAYQLAGDLGRAIPLFERTLADRERLLGADHPGTLTSRSNLAGACQLAGDLDRAIPLFERTLADRERSAGADHPDTLASRNNLAHALETAGDLRRAIPLLERTLADRERVLGPDHPDTLASRNNLAGAYRSAGDPGRAIPLFERTMADYERVLGPDHPGTLASRNNLAAAYRSAGDPGRAIPLHERTLADRERVLGPDHPDTLTSRNNLAYAFESAGDPGRAIPLLERTLADRERVLGPDHPHTLASRNNLAYVYQFVDAGRAVPLYERTLAEQERVLGSGHPDTLATRNNLAGAYQQAGDVGRAISLYERTLADRERVLGSDHPATLISRNNLAFAYRSTGHADRAIPLYERALADCERLVGADHPTTVIVRDNLTWATAQATPEPGPPATE
ncbi:FxSxx-COOH system tetratricopeptide repeat protein [Nonomuraea fuscirosea]|uniref:FxSxx-COOH system tetratricopeptide repeat protein n=1 Tax=Nonomuraea fuscirosea TaxID=1291556 RepID=UPI0033F99FD6